MSSDSEEFYEQASKVFYFKDGVLSATSYDDLVHFVIKHSSIIRSHGGEALVPKVLDRVNVTDKKFLMCWTHVYISYVHLSRNMRWKDQFIDDE